MAGCLLSMQKTLAPCSVIGKREREKKSLHLRPVIFLHNIIILAGFVQSIESFRENIDVPYEIGNTAASASP